VSFLRKQESRKNNWIPAFARMTYKGGQMERLLAPKSRSVQGFFSFG